MFGVYTELPNMEVFALQSQRHEVNVYGVFKLGSNSFPKKKKGSKFGTFRTEWGFVPAYAIRWGLRFTQWEF